MMKMDNGTASNNKIFELNDQDIELIVRMLHQELDAVNSIIERGDGQDINWLDRADHCQDLIIQLLS